MGRRAVEAAPACPQHPGSRTSYYDRRGDRRRVRCVPAAGISHLFTWPLAAPQAKRLASQISGVGFDRPSCPEHPDAKVWWDGFYGEESHRRPRYKCVRPGISGAALVHVFTERLPRQIPPSGECEECAREYERVDGPQSPREYAFVAREVAAGLYLAGKGDTYGSAAKETRRRAKRYSPSALYRVQAKGGNVVADWVEVWADLLYDELRGEVPVPETVVLDDLPFHVGKFHPETGFPTKSGQILFHVFGAVGYYRDRGQYQAARVIRLEASPKTNKEAWEDFLRRVPGPPERVVSDEATGILKGVPRAWPGVPMYVCVHHLWRQGYNHLAKRKLHGLKVPVRVLLDEALRHGARDPERWHAFATEVRTHHHGHKPLMNWVHAKDILIPSSSPPTTTPSATAPSRPPYAKSNAPSTTAASPSETENAPTGSSSSWSSTSTSSQTRPSTPASSAATSKPTPANHHPATSSSTHSVNGRSDRGSRSMQELRPFEPNVDQATGRSVRRRHEPTGTVHEEN
jgi:hypothetical protein